MHYASYYRWLVYSYLFARDGFPPRTDRPVLDIGCKGAEFLQRFDAPLKLGLDQTPAFFPQTGAGTLWLVTGDAARLPLRERSFGYVLMNDVIEHVPDDHAAMRCATSMVAPGGFLWVSTPAPNYRVGPEAVTRRFERAWGHVRKGYHPDMLAGMIGPDFAVRTIIWPEPLIRSVQLPLWGLSRLAMPLARRIAQHCFYYDRHVFDDGRAAHVLDGHVYLSAQRMPAPRTSTPRRQAD